MATNHLKTNTSFTYQPEGANQVWSMDFMQDNSIYPSEDLFTTYSIDTKQAISPMFQLIDEIAFLNLEETDLSLVSCPIFLKQVEETLIITGPDRASIFLFDKQGRFIRMINNLGQGLEEYALIKSIWIENNLIGIFGKDSLF